MTTANPQPLHLSLCGKVVSYQLNNRRHALALSEFKRRFSLTDEQAFRQYYRDNKRPSQNPNQAQVDTPPPSTGPQYTVPQLQKALQVQTAYVLTLQQQVAQLREQLAQALMQ